MGKRILVQSFEDLKDLPAQTPPDEVHTTWTGKPNEDMHQLLRSVLGAIYSKDEIDGVKVAKYEEEPEHLFRDVQNYMRDTYLNLWGMDRNEGSEVAPPEYGISRVIKHGRDVLRFEITDRPH